MDEVAHKARFDWLVEAAGAGAAGLCAGFATLKLAPSLGLEPAVGAGASGMTAFALGLLAMRAVEPDRREHSFADLSLKPIEIDATADVEAEQLLLDAVYHETASLADCVEGGELLLDDPLVADPDSRVVQLFASPPMPTAGELKRRIDRHLAAGAVHTERAHDQAAPDASAALYAALDDLRRSLR